MTKTLDTTMLQHAAALREMRLVLLRNPPRTGELHPDLTSRAEAVLLVLTTEAGPHTCGDLAKRLLTYKPAITRAMDTLERIGFAKRVPNPKDRRTPHFVAQPAGIDFAACMASALAVGLAAPEPIAA